MGVPSIPGKRNAWERVTRVDDTAHAADDRLTMIYDTREFRLACLRVRHFGTIAYREPVQSELCRFINRVEAGRGINLYNNFMDPRRIDQKKKNHRSIVGRFLE